LSSAGSYHRATAGSLLLLLLLGLGGAARAAGLSHVPPVEAAGGEDLLLRVRSEDALVAAGLELRWRPVGDADWRAARFVLDPDGSWHATVPAGDVRPPGLEYWLSGADDASAYGSERAPQRIVVMGSAAQLRQGIELFRHDFRRSTAEAHVSQRWFGPADGVADQTTTVGASYRYRSFRGLRSVQFGIERLRGATWEPSDGQTVAVDPAGYDVGYATLEVGPAVPFGLSGTLLLGAGVDGFTAGAGGAMRLGLEPGTHVRLAARAIQGAGWTSGLGLHWATVPRVPMAAVVEVSTVPAASADPAVLGRFELHPRFGEQASLDLAVGYQARRADLGGLMAGGGVTWSW
jgi:hypothetical protein